MSAAGKLLNALERYYQATLAYRQAAAKLLKADKHVPLKIAETRHPALTTSERDRLRQEISRQKSAATTAKAKLLGLIRSATVAEFETDESPEQMVSLAAAVQRDDWIRFIELWTDLQTTLWFAEMRSSDNEKPRPLTALQQSYVTAAAIWLKYKQTEQRKYVNGERRTEPTKADAYQVAKKLGWKGTKRQFALHSKEGIKPTLPWLELAKAKVKAINLPS